MVKIQQLFIVKNFFVWIQAFQVRHTRLTHTL